jgi:hypothetical protein
MNPPQKISVAYHLKNLFFILSIILLLFSSCRTKKKETASAYISEEERPWLTQFFSDIMLCEAGIYTLCGASKPMTLIQIDQYSDEQKKAFFDALTEEEKRDGCIFEGYNLSETWLKWEKISHRFPTKRYMLFKTDLYQEPDCFFVLFVDILKTATIIQDNYEAFRKAVGFDFHPLEVTIKINQKDSIFLNKLKGNSHLLGLLLGFGKTNSYIFHWKYFDLTSSSAEWFNNIPFRSSNEPMKGLIKFTIDNFGIPSFISFNEIDPIIDLYKEERIKIKNIYKDKDFLDLTLQKLTN